MYSSVDNITRREYPTHATIKETPLTEEFLPDPQAERCVPDARRRRPRGPLRRRRAKPRRQLFARLQHRQRVVARGVEIVCRDERQDDRAQVVVLRARRELERVFQMLSDAMGELPRRRGWRRTNVLTST